MTFEKYTPSDILKPFIKTFMIIESDTEVVSRVLPDTSLAMAFRYKGTVSYSKDNLKTDIPVSAITGLRRSARAWEYARETANILVMFNEGGPSVFFKEPLHELFDISLSLDHFIRRDKLNEIETRLTEAKNSLQRISIIEQFMISLMIKKQPDLLIFHAIQKIKSAKGTLRIKDLASSLYISQDPFEKKFRRIVGTSPKQFSNIVRLRNLIDNYSQSNTLTDVAHRAGYFDQAHFIKDFKSFTGETPQVFFADPFNW
ncbi:MAG: helix-turn-helix transcriptional regulator [Chitinophagaceae bacterium]